MLQKIEKSKKTHAGDKDRLDYLRALKIVCNGMIAWCERLADGFEAAAKTARTPPAAANLPIPPLHAAARRDFPRRVFVRRLPPFRYAFISIPTVSA